MKKWYFTYCIILSSIMLHAQNDRWDTIKKNLVFSSCSMVLDSFTIRPSSVMVTTIDNKAITGYAVKNNTIFFPPSTCPAILGKELTIRYSTFGGNIENFLTYSERQFEQEEKIFVFKTKKSSKDTRNKDDNKLSYDGAFSRGFSLGNRQDLSLNSRFNLNMRGKISDDISILAVLSDESIPIQAEGNTQYLKEFDRVFIQLKKDSTSLIAGDYPIANDHNHFLRYQKKIKGLGARHVHQSESLTVKGHGNVSISRGKFARQTLNISEGNLGPYKLDGNGSDRFVIVLSGTERVYLDGNLLTRGSTNDYIIDYNRAELVFTKSNFLSSNSRIIVEYEYQTQSYLRTLYSLGSGIEGENYTLGIDYYHESDSKNVSGEGLLDSSSVAYLSTIGNDIKRSFVSSIRPYDDTTSISTATYELRPYNDPQDTISNILVPSKDKTKTLYRAEFSDVGVGKGHYALDNTTLGNGRNYIFVGKDKGRYEPIISVTPPEKKSYLSLHGSYTLADKNTVYTQVILSDNDKNRFSDVGNAENRGLGAYVNYDGTHMLTEKNSITTSLSAEWTSKKFRPLNPYRDIEFLRNWNLTEQYEDQEWSLVGKLSYNMDARLKVGYTSQYFNQKSSYRGYHNSVHADYTMDRYYIKTRLPLLSSNDNTFETQYWSPHARAGAYFLADKSLSLEYRYITEHNTTRHTSLDSLSARSFSFAEQEFSAKKLFGSASITAKHRRRNDDYVHKNSFQRGRQASEWSLQGDITKSLFRGSFLLGYRTLDLDSLYRKQNNIVITDNLLANVSLDGKTKNKALKYTVFYQTNGGQAPKREFIYERVLEGQGSYIYIGNEDSTLVVSQFRYAPELGTANYIRIPLYNNEYIQTQNNQFTFNASLRMGRLLSGDSSTIHRILKKISTSHTINISNSIIPEEKNKTSALSLWAKKGIIQQSTSINNHLYINRGKAAYTIHFSNAFRQISSTQVNGRNDRSSNRYNLDTRLNIFTGIDIELKSHHETRSADVELIPAQNYRIISQLLKPGIRFRANKNWGFNAYYEYNNRRQTILNKETATSHGANGELIIRDLFGFNINSNLEYHIIQYHGKKNSTIEFDLLRGLKNGNNFRWVNNISRRVGKSTEVTLSLETRKYGETKWVYLGSAQIRALF